MGKIKIDFAVCAGEKCTLKENCLRHEMYKQKPKQGFSDRQVFVTPETEFICHNFSKIPKDEIT